MISHKQLEMLLDPQEAFDGASYEPKRDFIRLSGALSRIYGAMQDGGWWTLRSLAYVGKCSESAASARLRDLRKPKYGSFIIKCRHVANGLHEYRLTRGQ